MVLFKVNFDCAVHNDGTGRLFGIRDQRGCCLGVAARKIFIVIKLFWREILPRSAINYTKVLIDDVSVFGSTMANLRSLSHSFIYFDLHWKSRVCNKAAHEAAKMSRDCLDSSLKVWFEDIPLSIVVAMVAVSVFIKKNID